MTNLIKILVADDDPYIRELIATILKNSGYLVSEAENGLQAMEKLAFEKVDLCILDVMMPQMDGYESCRHIRKYHEDLPVLMLTAKGDLAHKVQGFEMGADDYLTKPFEAEELLMRIKALLRRYKIASSQSIVIGNVTMDQERYNLSLGQAFFDLPKKEFELLFMLGSYPGKTLSRDRLIESVWGIDFDGNERTLDVHINRLRERFLPEVCGFKITTIRGLGYRLEATYE